MNVNKINYSDLKALSEKDWLYSLLINPLVIGGALFLCISFFFGITLNGVMITVATIGAAWLLHSPLGWSEYRSNWVYYYRVELNNKTYYVVKDGARRVRVINHEGSVLQDIKTREIYTDKTLESWLESDSPKLGVITEKTNGSLTI